MLQKFKVVLELDAAAMAAVFCQEYLVQAILFQLDGKSLARAACVNPV